MGHRRGATYDRIVFQDCLEDHLGWHDSKSSLEPFYCRPTTPAENDTDAISCPTRRFSSDKGIPLRLTERALPACAAIEASETSVYPPRNDVYGRDSARDWQGIAELQVWNDLDAVSRATPPPDLPYLLRHRLAAAIAGPHVVWIEVNQEGDPNAFHDAPFFPDPQLVDYGVDERGQPSILYRVPITIGDEVVVAEAPAYAGYGSPDGQDGFVRPPDDTITTDVVGSGALRVEDVRVTFDPALRCETLPPITLDVVASDAGSVTLALVPIAGEVVGYDVRWIDGDVAIATNEEFERMPPGIEVGPGPEPFVVEGLDPDTPYTIGVRPKSICAAQTVTTILARTKPRAPREVGCGCAAAAAPVGLAAWVWALALVRIGRPSKR